MSQVSLVRGNVGFGLCTAFLVMLTPAGVARGANFVDFSPPLSPGTNFGGAFGDRPGDTLFTEDSVVVEGKLFQLPQQNFSSFNRATVGNQTQGGIGTMSHVPLSLNNISTTFELPSPVEQVTFNYQDFGGAENLRINGSALQVTGRLSDLNNATVGGANVSVTSSQVPGGGGVEGRVTLSDPSGSISSFTTGGQEFALDKIRAGSSTNELMSFGAGGERSWEEVLSDTSIRSVGDFTGPAAEFYDEAASQAPDIGSAQPVPPELIPDVPVEGAGGQQFPSLVMGWPDEPETLEVGAFDAEAPTRDLTNTSAHFSVNAPEDIWDVSLELIDENGNARSWFRPDDTDGEWREFWIDLDEPAPQESFPRFIQDANFDLSRVERLRLDEGTAEWTVEVPTPGTDERIGPWNAWNHLTIKEDAGDMNQDGEVNNLDINPFVLALTDEQAFENQFGVDPVAVGDTNGDGQFNNLDINPFVKLLTSSGSLRSVPEPTSLAWLALGGTLLAARRRRRQC